MTAGAAADTVCFPCVFSPSVSFADSSLVRGSHRGWRRNGRCARRWRRPSLRPASPSLPLTREAAKPKVLTEGETDDGWRNDGSGLLFRRFLSLSQLR